MGEKAAAEAAALDDLDLSAPIAEISEHFLHFWLDVNCHFPQNMGTMISSSLRRAIRKIQTQ